VEAAEVVTESERAREATGEERHRARRVRGDRGQPCEHERRKGEERSATRDGVQRAAGEPGGDEEQ